MENRIKIAGMLREMGADAALIMSRENLLYSTGFSGLEGACLIAADGKGTVITDMRYIEAAGKQITGYELLCTGEKDHKTLITETLQAWGAKQVAFEDTIMSVAKYNEMKSVLPVDLVPVQDGYIRLREIKSEAEVARIVKAQRIAEKALETLLPDLKAGAEEQALAAKLNYLMDSYGSRGTAFSTILVSGANSSLPHGVPGPKKLEEGDFVTIDFGAVVDGYRSDMTRTFAIGYATEEMKTVYNTVLQAQLAGIKAFEPGARGCDVHNAAHDVIRAAGYGQYFGHGLGHSLGINIHEAPRAAAKYQGTFKVGNIVTMEPGIYLPGKFGVRIEDMVYLAEDGKRNLTEFPKELMIL